MRNKYLPWYIIQGLKDAFPKGTRVELTHVHDPSSGVKPGDQGTVEAVEDDATIHISWDDGSTRSIFYSQDFIRRI